MVLTTFPLTPLPGWEGLLPAESLPSPVQIGFVFSGFARGLFPATLKTEKTFMSSFALGASRLRADARRFRLCDCFSSLLPRSDLVDRLASTSRGALTVAPPTPAALRTS